MNNEDNLKKALKINRIYTIICVINILSIAIGAMFIEYFYPIMPSGFNYGKTPILQYIGAQ